MLAPRKTRGKVKEEPLTADTSAVDNASPLFNHLTALQDEDDDDFNPAKKPRGSRKVPSMKPKAIRAREKALGEKFEEVQSRLDNQLEKGDGVVVDCFYHAPTKLATVRVDSDEVLS